MLTFRIGCPAQYLTMAAGTRQTMIRVLLAGLCGDRNDESHSSLYAFPRHVKLVIKTKHNMQHSMLSFTAHIKQHVNARS